MALSPRRAGSCAPGSRRPPGSRWRTLAPAKKAKNGVCTQIGNECFAWFATTSSKSRQNFLELLRAGHGDYVINAAALDYMGGRNLSGAVIGLLTDHETKRFADEALWRAHVVYLGREQQRPLAATKADLYAPQSAIPLLGPGSG